MINKISNTYNNHHYVPQWYQKNFIFNNKKQKELYYLELNPKQSTTQNGHIYYPKNPISRPTEHCFNEDNLYSLSINQQTIKLIETEIFGVIDKKSSDSINYFQNFQHPSVKPEALDYLLLHMSSQKLRTPKGLKWLENKFKIKNKNDLLEILVDLLYLYCAIWTDSIWQIADATNSNTKFILSDHPVTTYNKTCGPHSNLCRDYNDPDIRLNGTHTIFPLSLNKIIIITNLSWARNPYQNSKSTRPNPDFFRDAMFKFTDIQTHRLLTEQEVREINYIIKKRAYKYIASTEKEWLYPEKYVSKKWDSYGKGYLLMPDPRSLSLGGTIYVGHNNNATKVYDEYSRHPNNPDFEKESKTLSEKNTLYKFKGEFARLFGPYRRGRIFQSLQLEPEKDDDDYHQYHLSLEKKYRY